MTAVASYPTGGTESLQAGQFRRRRHGTRNCPRSRLSPIIAGCRRCGGGPIAQHLVLGRGVRNLVVRLLGPRSQAAKFGDRGVVVHAAVDEAASDDGAGASFAAPA